MRHMPGSTRADKDVTHHGQQTNTYTLRQRRKHSLQPHHKQVDSITNVDSPPHHNIHLTNKHKHRTLCFSQPAKPWWLHKQAAATSDLAALSIPAVAAAGGAAVIIGSYKRNNSTSALVQTTQVQATGNLVQGSKQASNSRQPTTNMQQEFTSSPSHISQI
jgi:hypothetical protein